MRALDASRAIPRGQWLCALWRARSAAGAGPQAPRRTDTCRNISFGINDLRVIKSLALGTFFKPKHSASCRVIGALRASMVRMPLSITHVKSRNHMRIARGLLR
jgi:hypothetical protein